MPKLNVTGLIDDLKKRTGEDRSRLAFLERARLRAAYPGEQGLPLLGIGSSCGKPAFALPFALTWTEQSLDALETLARQYHCRVHYGHLAHVVHVATNKELAALQDWTPFGVVYLRPDYAHAQELLRDLIAALTPHLASSERDPA